MSTFEMTSPHSIDVVRDRLRAETEPWRIGLHVPFSGRHMLFCGDIAGNEFRLIRIIDYQNSFQQVAYCRLVSQGEATRIIVHLRINLFAVSFAVIWTGRMGVAFLRLFAGNSKRRHNRPLV